MMMMHEDDDDDENKHSTVAGSDRSENDNDGIEYTIDPKTNTTTNYNG